MYKFVDIFGELSETFGDGSDQSSLLESRGQEVIQGPGVVAVIFMDVLQEVAGPPPEVGSCSLAAPHHGVDDCGIFGGVIVLAEQVVLPSYRYRADAVLDEVVVRQVAPVQMVSRKPVIYLVCVFDELAKNRLFDVIELR